MAPRLITLLRDLVPGVFFWPNPSLDSLLTMADFFWVSSSNRALLCDIAGRLVTSASLAEERSSGEVLGRRESALLVFDMGTIYPEDIFSMTALWRSRRRCCSS